MAYTTINKSTDYFNTVLYTGTNATQSITGVGFQPDFIWFKNRTGVNFNVLFNAVMGRAIGLTSNGTDVEISSLASRDLASFDSDGFTVGQTEYWGSTNISGASIVAWNWLANGAGVANTDGTISSTVSANTTSGFSIVSYTGNGTSGANIGHGLGATPAMIICKDRTTAEEWSVYHQSLTYTKYLVLESTAAAVTNSRFYQAPTSSLFYVSESNGVNKNADNYIAYCFAEVKGYSKFGSYTGNGSTDGTFIYTGFKPAWVMVKRTDTAGNSWRIWDKVRSPSNVMSLFLYANLSNAEDNDVTIDFLSNGFKFRNTSTDNNASGATYIYMAFAEQPLVGTNNVPATAR